LEETKGTRKSNRLNKIGSILYGIFLALIIVLIAFLFINKLLNRPAFLFHKSIAWVITESMEPEISRQSYILVEQVDSSEIKEGDVILFYSDDPSLQGNINTHRVVKVLDNGTEFVTKGDNNAIEDQYTAKADKIVARYVMVLPLLTKLMRFFLTANGLLVFIALILAITALIFVPDFIRALRDTQIEAEKKREEEKHKLLMAELERLKKEGLQEELFKNTPQG